MKGLSFGKYFGEALDQVRREAGLSRKALADVLEVDESSVWRWENGKSWPERPDEVVAVYEREATGVSAIDLWRDAMRRANEADAKGKLARFLTSEEFPTVAELEAGQVERAKKAAREARRASGSRPEQ